MTSEILQEVITALSNKNQLPSPPRELYHYTTLEVAQLILEGDNLRLSHAQYSNDQLELEMAKAVIDRCFRTHSAAPAFLRQVQATFAALAPDLDAYIFCLSTGDPQRISPHDLLSQWRAYGQDGRGCCLTLQTSGLSDLVHHMPGLRLNPVIYDRGVQTSLVTNILGLGDARFAAGNPNAVSATVSALVFTTPLMKDPGFSEEREWRLIFMPPYGVPQPQLGFQPRRDFLAPFVTLHHLWHQLRPKLVKIPELKPNPPSNKRALPSATPLVPVNSVMVGPSGHQALNVKAMRKVVTQAGRAIIPQASAIPYRSLG